jgi:hypothetical protein
MRMMPRCCVMPVIDQPAMGEWVRASMSGPVGVGGFEEGEFEAPEIEFATDSSLEGDGFEPSVPL